MDTSITLASLNVSGEVVFNNAVTYYFKSNFNFAFQNINLTSYWILVNNGGKLILGSNDTGCQITAKIILTVTGNRTTSSAMKTDPFDGSKLNAFLL